MQKEIYLAGGCFWGVEKYFSLIDGVIETQVGYANGNTDNPTYYQVCHENTNHAETVKIVYEDTGESLPVLLSLYYEIIDPTSIDRQGNDVGRQYRTGIYYTDPGDLPAIEASLDGLRRSLGRELAIEVLPLKSFWHAEEYHQKYLEKNPEGYCHIGRDHFERAKRATLSR